MFMVEKISDIVVGTKEISYFFNLFLFIFGYPKVCTEAVAFFSLKQAHHQILAPLMKVNHRLYF